jgi:hypothetical protein
VSLVDTVVPEVQTTLDEAELCSAQSSVDF